MGQGNGIMSKKRRDKIIESCDKHGDSPELKSLMIELNDIVEKRNRANNEYNLLSEGVRKSLLGKEINNYNSRASEIKEILRLRGNDLNAEIRNVIGHCLPKGLFSQILRLAHKRLEDSKFKLPFINPLSEEEERKINNYADLEKEIRSLKTKISAAKKMAQDLTPNMIGVSDNDEYNRRLELIKSFGKIVKELN